MALIVGDLTAETLARLLKHALERPPSGAPLDMHQHTLASGAPVISIIPSSDGERLSTHGDLAERPAVASVSTDPAQPR